MKTTLKLIKKDVIRFLNDKPAVLLTFIVPIVLIIIFASIFGGQGNGGTRRTSIILVNESNSAVAKYIEEKLDSAKSLRIIKDYESQKGEERIKYTEEEAIDLVKKGQISAALILPEDCFTDTSTSVKFKMYYDPKNEIEYSILQGSIQKTIMTQIPRLFPILMQRQSTRALNDEGDSFISDFAGIISEYYDVSKEDVLASMTINDSTILSEESSGDDSNFMQNMIKFESEQVVGQEIKNPAVTRIVGGWAIMFLLFSLTGAASSFFEEKQEGSLKRLLCMPVRRSHLLWSKYIYSIMLGCVQLFVMFAFAWIFYEVDIFSNFFNLIIVILFSASAAVAFGMIITVFAKTLNQANGIATLVILVMSAVGGSWFPTSFFPDWLQVVSRFTLTYWSVEAFLQVLWRQVGLADIILHLSILLSIAVVVNSLAIYQFKKGKVF